MGVNGYLIALRSIKSKNGEIYYMVDYVLETINGFKIHSDFVSSEVFKSIAEKNIKFMTQKVVFLYDLTDSLRARLIDIK